MDLKRVIYFALIANFTLYNNSNASVSEDIKHNLSSVTEVNTSNDLFLQQNNFSSDVILYPNENIFKLLNDEYVMLPVQQNNNSTNNNQLNILHNNQINNENDNLNKNHNGNTIMNVNGKDVKLEKKEVFVIIYQTFSYFCKSTIITWYY